MVQAAAADFMMLKKILIANRGEIAVRIIRTCRDMGIGTVAVYSEADRGALHVRMADEAYFIGPAPSRESYLVIEKIIGAAGRAKADSIHPGYGFLAENAAFSKACSDAGIVFIGPSSESIALMGSKIEARRAVAKFGVESVPGTLDPILADEEARKIAKSVGYPIMLKASGGGGGKGLRLVRTEEELTSALRNTRSEALAAFGDDSIYIEKFVDSPHHVEIQVLADRHGNAVYLGERDCTIQRRHQKVIEECPSPIIDPELRSRMGEAALKVVKAANYYNAGTVEFLVDRHKNFYFLEMNTRLQVEHPVTEMVTGFDLVKLQILIASGEELAIRQEDVQLRGAAVECRIYAEDPDNNFFPSPGKILRLRTPSGPGVRDDSGVYEGWTVPIDYDPLISKLVTWGATRDDAIDRMRRALQEYHVGGIKSNVSFFLEILKHADFRKGEFDTGFIERWMRTRPSASNDGQAARDLAAIASVLFDSSRTALPVSPPNENQNLWKLDGRRRALRER
jgi:acetyl-CoA carboxylase biotin carboxylase subunit